MPSLDDLFFADFPNDRLDKYDLRKWLIGEAVVRGWQWVPLRTDELTGVHGPRGLFLAIDPTDRGQVLEVRVDVECGGLKLTAGDRTEIVETAY